VELGWAVLNPVLVDVVPLLDPVSVVLIWVELGPVLVELVSVELDPVSVVLVLVLVWDVLDPVSVVEVLVVGSETNAVLGVVDTEVVEGCNVSDVVVGVVDVVEL